MIVSLQGRANTRPVLDLAQPKVLVVGGSGFIGKALQAAALDRGTGDLFDFTYYSHPHEIKDCFTKVKLDLSHHAGAAHVATEYKTAIYVTGNSNAAISRSDPWTDLTMNVRHLLNFIRYFRGNLVMLSSQAVYYGLDGKQREDVNHVPVVPYGISKRMAEDYAEYMTEMGYLEKLWIFRLRYAFGQGEKPSRLMSMCNLAALKGGAVQIHGTGKSIMNPLPAEWVGEVLMRAAETLAFERERTINITNLNSPDKMTVLQMVEELADERPFNYTLSGKEEWPVNFWGDTESLTGQLKIWRLSFPNVASELRKRFADMEYEPLATSKKSDEGHAHKQTSVKRD